MFCRILFFFPAWMFDQNTSLHTFACCPRVPHTPLAVFYSQRAKACSISQKSFNLPVKKRHTAQQRKAERHNFKNPFAPFVCFAVHYPPRVLKKSVEETSPVSSENLGIARQPKALLPDEKENTGIAGLCLGFPTSFGGKSSVMARTWALDRFLIQACESNPQSA